MKSTKQSHRFGITVAGAMVLAEVRTGSSRYPSARLERRKHTADAGIGASSGADVWLPLPLLLLLSYSSTPGRPMGDHSPCPELGAAARPVARIVQLACAGYAEVGTGRDRGNCAGIHRDDTKKTDQQRVRCAVSTTVKGLSVATYDKMVRKGILPETNRFELILGRIVEKDVKGPEHRIATRQTLQAIERLLPAGWHANKEEPVGVPGSKSEPEPDISVVRGEPEDYGDRNPGAADVALVVEVTRTSAAKDRKLARIYAAGNIPVYWIVNVPKRQLEVYEGPAGGQYPPARILREGESVDLVIGGQLLGQIAVAGLLPKPKK